MLVCPTCKGSLRLEAEEEKGGEVISGMLYCPKCKASYPIEEAIPNMLPPQERSQSGL